MAMDPRDWGLGFLKEAWDKLAYGSPGELSQEAGDSLGGVNQEVFYSQGEVNQEVANQAMPWPFPRKGDAFDNLFTHKGYLRRDLISDLLDKVYFYPPSENWCGDHYCFQGNPEKNAAFYYMVRSISNEYSVRIVLTTKCVVAQKDLAFLFFDSSGRLRRKELDFFMKPLSAWGNFLDYLPDYRAEFEEEDARFLLAIYLCMVSDIYKKVDELGIRLFTDADWSVAAYFFPGMVTCKAWYKG